MAKRMCSYEGCKRPVKARSLCSAHYKRLWRHGDPAIVKKAPDGSRAAASCRVDGCDRPVKARRLCNAHYHRQYVGRPLDGKAIRVYVRGVDVCMVDGCDLPTKGRGWCAAHYNRWLRNGDPLVTRRAANGSKLAWVRLAADHQGDGCVDFPFPLSGGRPFLDHRPAGQVVLELAGRPQPTPGHWALHSCDRPPCCNPRHLRWGTVHENNADMVRRNRHMWQRHQTLVAWVESLGILVPDDMR